MNSIESLMIEKFAMVTETHQSITYVEMIIWFIVMLLLLVLTVCGNFLTICAIIFTRKLGALVSNRFVLSLALSDLLVGLAIPYHFIFSVGITLGSNRETCVIRFVLVIFACASSIFNLMVIAADRYAAVVYPLEYGKYMRKKLAYGIIVFGWLITFALSTVVVIWNNWDINQDNCSFTEIIPQNYIIFILTPMFASVWVVIIVLYLKIWRIAASHAKKIRTCVLQTSKYTGTDWKSIQVVLLVLGCFSVCWLPYFIMITCYKLLGDIPFLVYEITFILAMANSCMNPLIYAWKNSNYREAFLSMLKCKSPNSIGSQFHEYVTDHTPTGTNSREPNKPDKTVAVIENGLKPPIKSLEEEITIMEKNTKDIDWDATLPR
ncbi:adenosine receptor A2b [Onthophagus taurus]|uniref:adenosine receptor A2b n=1 Tax=Onthophagus taurus TaxID=166361 RepID=UPI000C1FF0C9|nr:adenosine receptor A2b [Onthophagus taurus]